MALPTFQRMTIEPRETVLMMTKTEKLEFIPNRKITKFRNLNSEMIFENLKPLKTIKLEVWLIIELKLKKLGKIIIPDWLSLPQLKNNFQAEVRDLQFSELPFFWFEMSKLLIEIAPDDIESLEQVKKILKDLKEVRQNKLRNSLKFNLSNQNNSSQQRQYNFSNSFNHLEVPNLSHFELNEIRSTLTILNSKFLKLDNTTNQDPSQIEQSINSFQDQQIGQQQFNNSDSFNQSYSAFEFHSDHQPQQQSSSSINLNLHNQSSSILNTSSMTDD